jgi:peptide methionine sulfoxide reductase MsrA
MVAKYVAVALVLVGSVASESADPSAETPTGKPIGVYFGCGCFWHMQHVFVEAEMNNLSRKNDEITSRAGYAGGTKLGPGGEICYHNDKNESVYADLGHAEIASMEIPEDAFAAFANAFWTGCPNGLREDQFDAGGEYRSLVGLPGGMNSTLIPALRAKAGSVKLVAGVGDEPDTYGHGVVLVYDIAKFPPHTAEKYHQFHNDFLAPDYPASYHELQKMCKATSCPCSFLGCDNQTSPSLVHV